MTESELFLEGINLMLSGMGFVLVFLLILIYALRLMSAVVNRLYPEVPVVTTPKSASIAPTPTDDLERLRPVIVAAIAHHRRVQGLN